MKKGISLFAGICLTLGISAQQTIIPDNYWKEFEANYGQYDSWWEVDDQTVNVKGLTGLTPKNGMKVAEGSISNNAYTIETEGDVFKIRYEKTASYEKFGLSWMEWAYPDNCASDNWQLVNPITGEEWADGCHRTAKGNSVDFSDPANRIISFKYQALGDAPINLRVDLWDIKGRKTTKEGYVCTDGLEKVSAYAPKDESAWQQFAVIYADQENAEEGALDELEEYFDNTYFYGTCSGILEDGNNTWWNGIQFDAQPTFGLKLDPSRIIGIEVYINCDVSTKGQVSEIYIKDLTVGNTLTRDDASEFTAIETIAGEGSVEIVNGVVYSEGRIIILDILGQTVKSAKEELNISDLPAGVYFVQTAEGTAKFVK
ncbi:MAG: T9SS type A sorting domain-containing protein [Bacteroidales bacterium]|nr:T9SS type A sorting domain-containing protein [Bacteroidales bacterium]